jgi:hypothetical protein
MSVTGFWLDRSNPGVSDLVRQFMAPNGMQFANGDACYVSTSTTTSGPSTTYDAGLLIQANAQTSPVQYIFLTATTPKSELRQATYDLIDSNFGPVDVIEVSDGNASFPIVMNTQFPLATFDGTAANANTTTNLILFTGSGSTNDFNGGQVYVNETGAQYTIINDTVGGGVHTLTIAPAAPVAITTGNTLRVVPWGPGYKGGVKLQATNPQQGISVAVADKTGGPIFIYGVNLMLRTAYVRFSPELI